jgi:predicted metal-dependent phosphotriesterase family hydrolase
MNKEDFKVGQQVFVLSTSRRYTVNGGRTVIECTVKSIGRKYLVVSRDGYSDSWDIKFDMTDDFREATDYAVYNHLYLTEQEILDEMRRDRLILKVNTFFRQYISSRCSTEFFEQVEALIDKELKEG